MAASEWDSGLSRHQNDAINPVAQEHVQIGDLLIVIIHGAAEEGAIVVGSQTLFDGVAEVAEVEVVEPWYQHPNGFAVLAA